MKGNKYAGFWIRLVATAIDSVIFYFFSWLLSYALIFSDYSFLKIALISILLYLIFDAVYEILLTSLYGGTVGKLLLRIKVIDSKGSKISIGRSIGRYFAKYISGLVLFIGYLMVAWDPEKQGIHDKIAKTYVIHNQKSRVSKKLRNIFITVFIIVIAGYIAFNAAVFSYSVGFGIKAGLEKLDVHDPVSKVQQICKSKFGYVSDICYLAFKDEKAILALNSSELKRYCSLITEKSMNANCLSAFAMKERDKSFCLNAKSAKSVRTCEKTYEFAAGLLNSFNESKSEYELEVEAYNQTFSNGTLLLGYLNQNACIPINSYVYTYDEKPCISINDLGDFQLDEKTKMHWNGNILRIYDESGKLIDSSRSLFDEDAKSFLPSNKMESWLRDFNLDKLAPGNYTIVYSVYDLIGKKAINLNQSFSVKEKYDFGTLKVKSFFIGSTLDSAYCTQKSSRQFDKGDNVCLEPVVYGFEKGFDKFNMFDMDLKVTNETGSLFDYAENIFGEKGKFILVDDTLSEQFAIIGTAKYPKGNYVFELKIKDLISRKSATVNETFFVQ